MASLFGGPQPQATATESDAGGGSDVFGFVGSSEGAGASGGSAFSFLNSEVTQAPPGESVFSFLNSEEPKCPTEVTAEPSGGATEKSSPLETSAAPLSSAFSFVSGGSQSSYAPIEPAGSQSSYPAAASMLGSLDQAPIEPAGLDGARKKTRKALRPGHASRPEEAAQDAPLGHDFQAKPPPPPEPMEQHTYDTGPLDQLAAEAQGAAGLSPVQEVTMDRAPVQTVESKTVEPSQATHIPEPVEQAPAVEGRSPEPMDRPPEPAEKPLREPEAATPEPKPELKPEQKPPPPPPPPPSPEEQLQRAFNVSGVRQWLDVQLLESEKEHRRLLEAEASCLSASQQTAENITALRAKLEKTEAEQNSLCDKEQYEEADALDVTIQELKDKISKEFEEVASGAKKLVTFAGSLLSLSRDRASLAKQALDRVEALQLEGDEAFKTTEERCQRRLSAEQARLESERKRMDLAESHIQKDSANLQEEWQQVNEAIDQQTVEDVDERDTAMAKRSELDEEIRELERLLAKKLEQRKELTQVIDSCDIRVASIRSKFEKQLGRLEGKQKRLEEAQKEMEVDSQQVSQMEAELEKEREALKDQETYHRQQMKEIRKASKDLRRQRWFQSEVIQRRVVWQRLMEPHRDSLNEARKGWEQATQKCGELSARSASQEAEAAKLRSQIDASVQALPSLEAEKKLAVASRSFKEAGRLTEEIRRREEGKKKFEAELESLQAELASAREALAECRQSEQDSQGELLKVEENCAVEELRVLRHQVSDLEELCKLPSVSSSDRRLYEQEVSVLKHQQEHLAKKYNIDPAGLEDIPTDVVESLEDKRVIEVPSDDSEDEQVPNGTSEPGVVTSLASSAEPEVSSPKEAEVSSPKEAEAEANGEADEAGEAGAAQAGAALSPRAAQERLTQLVAGIEDLKAELGALEPQIDTACEVEDYDLAEELENKRRELAQQQEDLEKELEELRQQLPEDEDVEVKEPKEEQCVPEEGCEAEPEAPQEAPESPQAQDAPDSLQEAPEPTAAEESEKAES
ncbi:unnamed protein product [Effrenium voratum]|nr:unnamed protein product [Effrenium voratum]